MANGSGGKAQVTWNIVLPASALGLLATIVVLVAKDIGSVQTVNNNQANELLLLHGELNILEGKINLMQEEMLDRTQLRYTSRDAEKDHAALLHRIVVAEERIKEIEKQDRKDHGK